MGALFTCRRSQRRAFQSTIGPQHPSCRRVGRGVVSLQQSLRWTHGRDSGRRSRLQRWRTSAPSLTPRKGERLHSPGFSGATMTLKPGKCKLACARCIAAPSASADHFPHRPRDARSFLLCHLRQSTHASGQHSEGTARVSNRTCYTPCTTNAGGWSRGCSSRNRWRGLTATRLATASGRGERGRRRKRYN